MTRSGIEEIELIIRSHVVRSRRGGRLGREPERRRMAVWAESYRRGKLSLFALLNWRQPRILLLHARELPSPLLFPVLATARYHLARIVATGQASNETNDSSITSTISH
jgi:hypothetical protein